MSYFDVDPTKPIDELLKNVRDAAMTNAPHNRLTVTPFATLIVRLSKDASETADKNIKLSEVASEAANRNLAITKTILRISIAQLVLAFFLACWQVWEKIF